MEKERHLYYFVSDVHLGLEYKDPAEREKKFSRFLLSLPANTKALFLLGDIFDFWYEYKNVIPRKFTRTLGALAQVADRGIEIYFFNGNHDIWTYSYFEQEIGIKILKQPYIIDLEGKRFCLGHGDGLGKGDTGYKLLRSIFYNRFLQFLFSGIHPRWAFALAHTWSRHNRLAHECQGDIIKQNREKIETTEDQISSCFELREDSGIVKFANDFQLNQKHAPLDYFIFGHFHYRTIVDLKAGGKLYILGEWIHSCDYLVFDGEKLESFIYK